MGGSQLGRNRLAADRPVCCSFRTPVELCQCSEPPAVSAASSRRGCMVPRGGSSALVATAPGALVLTVNEFPRSKGLFPSRFVYTVTVCRWAKMLLQYPKQLQLRHAKQSLSTTLQPFGYVFNKTRRLFAQKKTMYHDHCN